MYFSIKNNLFILTNIFLLSFICSKNIFLSNDDIEG